MATDPQSLTAQGSMYSQSTALQWQWMKLALLSQILTQLNPMAATDPGTLINVATPYQVYPPQTLQLFELALLAQIVVTIGNVPGGGSGITCNNYGGNAPIFIPSSGCGFASDSSNGHLWQYLNGAWRDTGISVAH